MGSFSAGLDLVRRAEALPVAVIRPHRSVIDKDDLLGYECNEANITITFIHVMVMAGIIHRWAFLY